MSKNNSRDRSGTRNGQLRVSHAIDLLLSPAPKARRRTNTPKKQPSAQVLQAAQRIEALPKSQQRFVVQLIDLLGYK